MAVGLETAIAVVGQLLGELFGKKKGPSTYQQTQEAMGALAKYAREYGEQYGFNPPDPSRRFIARSSRPDHG